MTYIKSIITRATGAQLIFIIMFLVTVFIFETTALPEKYALSGWSPVEWTTKVMHPENFKADFSNGVENYKHSSFMWIYPAFQKYFGLRALQLNYLVIFGEMLITVFLFALLYVVFIQNSSKEIDHFVFLILSILVLASNIRYANGARFSLPFWSGLYYVYVDFFRILALIMIALEKRVWAAILFVIAYTIHPAATLHALILGVFFMIPDLKRIVKKRDTYIALLIFLSGIGIWSFFNYKDSNLESSQIPKQTWIALTELMNFHWYPFSLDLFGVYANRHVIPLFSFMVLGLYVLLTEQRLKFSKNIMLGFISIILMVILGWVNSEYFQIISVIKISFQRSSDLIYFLVLPIIVFRFLKTFNSVNVVSSSLAVYLIFSVFLNYGFPLLPVILFCLSDYSKSVKIKYIKVILFTMILLLGAVLNRYLSSEFYFQLAVVGNIYLFNLYCLSLSYFLGYQWLKLHKKEMSYFILSVGCLYLSYFWVTNRVPTETTVEYGRNYLSSQIWAKNNTATQSNFFVDPSILYGWRDFSERSSFGNFREWLHTSWLYDSKYETFVEGMRRFDLLKISLQSYLEKPIKQINHDKLFADVQKSFYNFSEQDLRHICLDNKLSYVVMQKKMISRELKLKTAFENKDFIIYDMHDTN